MNKNNSKCTKRFYNLSLPFEVERLEQLDTEFRNGEKVRELIKRKRTLHEYLMNDAPEKMKSEMLEYDDINSYIIDLLLKFIYKKGFIDCRAIMRFLFRGKNNIKMNINVT